MSKSEKQHYHMQDTRSGAVVHISLDCPVKFVTM